MPSIFVCYRREDSAPYAGRLHDRLIPTFGKEHIFRDVEAIAPGVDFEDEIRRILARIDVMLVVIGPRWLEIVEGSRRIDRADDYVRMEIGIALQRGLRVIPVLVGHGTLPANATLPEDIRALVRRQAVELTDSRWEYDTGRLIASVDGADGVLQQENSSPRSVAPQVTPARPVVDPRIVNRPVNLGFDGPTMNGQPHGWFNSTGYVWGVSDRYEAQVVPPEDGRSGACVMLLQKTATAEEFGSLMQRFPATFLAGRTLRFEGELKTANVTGWAGLWIRADAEDIPNLVFDNMFNRGPRDTRPWSRYSVEIHVPLNTVWLNIGIVLNGGGTVWADGLQLRVWNRAGHWEDV